MSDDLSERLRQGWPHRGADARILCEEAAAELEALWKRIAGAEALLREAREKLHDWHTQSKEQFGGGGMCEYDFCRACGEPDYRPHQQGCEHVDRIARIDAYLAGGGK